MEAPWELCGEGALPGTRYGPSGVTAAIYFF